MTLSTAISTLCDREGTEYEVDPDTGCWNWLKGKTKYGYAWGHAHRKYWAAVNGPVPEGFHVHHECHNPSCVNPDHLEPREARQHLTEHRRAGSHLTLEIVLSIRERAANGETTPAIARDLGYVLGTVHNIICGHSWKDVGGVIGARPANCAYELCAAPLPLDRRRSRIYCNVDCRARAWRYRQGIVARPHTWKDAT